ncbi:unnamed protein product [Cylicocyclus nassatus]|uniref:Uncharacterized protein n=1 Tax=Cylicocyclus nassatus TaxID=53992 RepID=A0AA36GVH6_CYLNA|nr:unnamed protein product [Cylicocyclus nassatus]
MCIFSACGQIVFGVVMVGCLILTAVPTFSGKMLRWDCIKDIKNCEDITDHEGYMKTVAIFMCLALLFELIALAWNLFVFCACCCKKYLIHPLAILSLIATIMLLIAVIVYGVNNKDSMQKLEDKSKDQYGYSFWLSICALVLAAVDTVIAAVTVCLGTRGL